MRVFHCFCIHLVYTKFQEVLTYLWHRLYCQIAKFPRYFYRALLYFLSSFFFLENIVFHKFHVFNKLYIFFFLCMWYRKELLPFWLLKMPRFAELSFFSLSRLHEFYCKFISNWHVIIESLILSKTTWKTWIKAWKIKKYIYTNMINVHVPFYMRFEGYKSI